MTRIFLTKKFSRWSDNAGLEDDELEKIIAEVEDGLIDADLGGSVFKKRIGINNQGKRGSLRTIIGFRAGDKAVFLYGFPKGAKANINRQEKAAFKEMAKVYFRMSEQQLQIAMNAGAIREIIRGSYE